MKILDVLADNLNPQKARILLQLALTKTPKPDEIQRMFEAVALVVPVAVPDRDGVVFRGRAGVAEFFAYVATMQIQTGVGDVYVAGGLDSMTHFRIPTITDGMDMESVISRYCT